MKKCIIFFLIFLLFPRAISAAVLPRFQTVKKVNISPSYGVTVQPKLRADHQSLYVTFINVKKVNSITYTLTYQTNGKDEGVSGSVDSSQGNKIDRELLFGTCSSGVCTYHQNISNMKLEISIQYTNGKTVIKRYRVKV